MTMTIRAATVDDASGIAQVQAKSWRTTYSECAAPTAAATILEKEMKL